MSSKRKSPPTKLEGGCTTEAGKLAHESIASIKTENDDIDHPELDTKDRNSASPMHRQDSTDHNDLEHPAYKKPKVNFDNQVSVDSMLISFAIFFPPFNIFHD